MKYPISQATRDEIHQHAVEEYPFECCGIVLGTPGTHDEDVLYRCTNIQNKLHELDPETYTRDARTAFYIEPRELMGILRDADGRGLRIKLFYHSHPEHDAYFSEEDKRMALFDGEPVYPDAGYQVVSVYDRQVKRDAFFTWNPEIREFEELGC